MADYGFVHEGRVYTPNRTAGIDPAASDARNRAIEADELAAWAGQPDHFVGYYEFPWDGYHSYTTDQQATGDPMLRPCAYCGRPRSSHAAKERDMARVWRKAFYPLHTGATITTWLGTTLGQITKARVYTNNFGARLVSITVRGSNGATYHGRASWDGGSIVRLHRSKKVASHA